MARSDSHLLLEPSAPAKSNLGDATMKTGKSRVDCNGNLINGAYAETFKDGSAACAGEYVGGERTEGSPPCNVEILRQVSG